MTTSTRNTFDLTGKVVLATGGNSGIGLACLTGCSRQGADVVIWDRDASRHGGALNVLRSAGAPRVHAKTVDVTSEEYVRRAFTATVEHMGRVDCVVANAGVSSRAPSFADLTTEMFTSS